MVPDGIGLDALIQYSVEDCCAIDTDIEHYLAGVQVRMNELLQGSVKDEISAYAAAADKEDYDFDMMPNMRQYIQLMFQSSFASVLKGRHPRVVTQDTGVEELKIMIGWAGSKE